MDRLLPERPDIYLDEESSVEKIIICQPTTSYSVLQSCSITVSIPTFNGACRITKVLDHLKLQTGVESLNWAVVVVDNNSNDDTVEVLKDYGSQNSLPYHLVCIPESQQGAAFARQRAIQAAYTDWVCFLDDDILPESHWLSSAMEFIKKVGNVAVFGGQIHGKFEAVPPKDFHRIQSFLAIRERGNAAHKYDPARLILPPSASWVVRRKAWLSAVPSRPTLGGRARGSMIQGDDYEPLIHLHRAGWEIWYCPDMHVNHHIPSWRLEKEYLVNLSRGCGLCVCSLRMMGVSAVQGPMVFARVTLGSLKRLIHHWLKHRRKIDSDLVLLCENAFFLGSFFSSFYFLRIMLRPKI